ncbi:hypothetical protein [Arsenicicoccus cauae]|nr:hypothetical protein [Arsenicicoccus cauae]
MSPTAAAQSAVAVAYALGFGAVLLVGLLMSQPLLVRGRTT